jgi:hypothetical protein
VRAARKYFQREGVADRPEPDSVLSAFRDALPPGDRAIFEALAEQHDAGEGVPHAHRLTAGQRRVLKLWHAFAAASGAECPPDPGGFWGPRRTRADRRRFRRLFRGMGSPRRHDTGAGRWLPLSVARAHAAARYAREVLEGLGAGDDRTAVRRLLADPLGTRAIRDVRHPPGPGPVALLANALARTGPPALHLGAAQVDRVALFREAPRLI